MTWGRLSISRLNHRDSPLVIAMVEDITPARESEERFRLVANTAPVMIWMSGTDKLCTYVNRPWLDFTGRALQQELGGGWADSVHPDDRDRSLEIYQQAFDRRHSFTVEYRLRTRRFDADRYELVSNDARATSAPATYPAASVSERFIRTPVSP